MNIGFAFTILFLAIGPLRVIPLFYEYTEQADRAYRIRAALLATLIAIAVVAVVAVLGAGTLDRWKVSSAALEIAIGILLLRSTFTSIPHLESLMLPSAKRSASVGTKRVSAAALALSPIAIPNVISATGVVTITLFLSLARNDQVLLREIYIVLLALLALDLCGMLFADFIMKVARVPTLVILGWIFAALQTALAVELLLAGLRLAGVISR